LKLRMRFEHFRIGPIQSISCAYTTSDYYPSSYSSNITYKQN
ncbi:unnamed protein product, partial [Rotaria magnacalcarata]